MYFLNSSLIRLFTFPRRRLILPAVTALKIITIRKGAGRGKHWNWKQMVEVEGEASLHVAVWWPVSRARRWIPPCATHVQKNCPALHCSERNSIEFRLLRQAVSSFPFGRDSWSYQATATTLMREKQLGTFLTVHRKSTPEFFVPRLSNWINNNRCLVKTCGDEQQNKPKWWPPCMQAWDRQKIQRRQSAGVVDMSPRPQISAPILKPSSLQKKKVEIIQSSEAEILKSSCLDKKKEYWNHPVFRKELYIWIISVQVLRGTESLVRRRTDRHDIWMENAKR